MKNISVFILAAILVLSMAACSQSNEEQGEQEAALQEEVAAAEQEEEVSVEVEETEQEEPGDEVDYSTDPSEWLYQLQTEDGNIQALMAIDACEYGTAGASLKQTNAALQLLNLTVAEDPETALESYLSEMNATQKDYFSFQWKMVVKYAEELLDGEDHSAQLEESGNGDVDLSLFSKDALNMLHETVTSALQNEGVSDEWKNNLEQEPFIHYTDGEASAVL